MTETHQEVVDDIIEQTLAMDDENSTLNKAMYQIVKLAFDPLLTGTENIPEEPSLFVGNHSTMALDTLVLGPVFYNQTGRLIRGMSDKSIYQKPAVRRQMIKLGGVMGDHQIGNAMFDAGKNVLVFPGGAHEIAKPVAERYKLKWKERMGFVKLAIRNSVPIVPLATVGPDEWYDRHIETDQWLNSPIGEALQKLGILSKGFSPDYAPPILKGKMGTLFPKLERVFIGIGKPIPTAQFSRKLPSEKKMMGFRNQVAQSIENMIGNLMVLRSQEGKGIVRKLLS